MTATASTHSKLLAESKTLSLAADVLEAGSDSLEVRRACRELLVQERRPETVSDLVRWSALRRIIGETFIPDHPGVTEPDIEDELELALFEATAHAWLAWLRGSPSEPGKGLRTAREALEGREGGLLHRLALGYWSEAVEALLGDDVPEARRLFRRAIEVGGQFGTESSPTVLWSYVATFLP